MLFYNQILGLDVLLAGLVPTIAIFADAISDPFIAFPDNAKPGLVGDETLWWLGVVDSPLSILPGIIAAALYAQYRINKSSYEKTRKKLSRRLK